ncbi:MAG TPA: hypothetical protein VGS23_00685 [Thermoplasmata archaeon]|nr:hypothetical protein [Thermoplasmata archaeon]
MTSLTERNIGYAFGLLGALLIGLGAILALALGAADLVIGRSIGAASMVGESVVLFVVACLAGFFAYLGNHGWSDRPFVSGVILVVVALLGWGLLGVGTDLLAIVGGIFVFLGGVLYLVEPTKRAVIAAASA